MCSVSTLCFPESLHGKFDSTNEQTDNRWYLRLSNADVKPVMCSTKSDWQHAKNGLKITNEDAKTSNLPNVSLLYRMLVTADLFWTWNLSFLNWNVTQDSLLRLTRYKTLILSQFWRHQGYFFRLEAKSHRRHYKTVLVLLTRKLTFWFKTGGALKSLPSYSKTKNLRKKWD